jgi:hypothetical protein
MVSGRPAAASDERSGSAEPYIPFDMSAPFVETPQRGVWVRRSGRNLGFGIAWAAMAVAWLAVGVLILGLSDVSFGNRLGAAAIFIVPAVGVLKVALGCIRAGVLVTDSEVIVRGPWTTRRFALNEVDHFEAKLQEELEGSNSTGGVVVILRDGRRFSVWALAKESFAWNNEAVAERWHPTSAALNRLVHAASP